MARHREVELRREHVRIARASGERLAEEALGAAALVDVGGVEQRDPELEGPVDDEARPVGRDAAAQGQPRAERDLGDDEVAGAQAAIAHARLLPVSIGSAEWRRATLGQSGIEVTRIVLGCGNFGGVGSAPEWFGHGTPPDEAFRIMDAAWELGITTFDTADAYGGGRSESTIGEWLRTKGPDVRDRLAIETKTYNPMETGADIGLARERIRRQLETSLGRLGVERVALYMAHDFDPEVPQEETLLAFDELRRAGKIGAVGASNFDADQLAEAVEISELEGVARYEWVQNSFSLLEQGDRETVLPVCREHGLGYESYGPLAGGWLTGKYRRGEPPPPGSRMTQRPGVVRGVPNRPRLRRDRDVRARSGRARRLGGRARARLAARPGRRDSAVVVGPGRVEQLAPVAEALALELSPADRDRLGKIFA